MSAPELSPEEAAIVARFEAAEYPAEVVLERVRALADKWGQRESTEMRQRTRALRAALDGR